MNIRHTCVTIVMVGGILLLTGGAVQAQVGGGIPPGGSGTGSGSKWEGETQMHPGER